ncbi:MAG: lysine exporter LysO family protein [Anaerovoracaceae bacterium]
MTWMPFACLAAGFGISLLPLTSKQLKGIDWVVNIALVVLMLTIGMNVGVNDEVISNLASIGINCAVIALCAIAASVFFVFLLEKTILPLKSLEEKVKNQHIDTGKILHTEESENDFDKQIENLKNKGNEDINLDKKKSSQKKEKKIQPLLIVMPASIIIGVLIGFFILTESSSSLLGKSLLFSLIVLYTGVGISLGSNREVFAFIKLLGFKVLLISLAIFIGSFLGGLLAELIVDIPKGYGLISASGMSYYSLTGAMMTQELGPLAGTYGFLVNVMREFFTILLLPILVKISKGSPIAGGAAGNMDTMLFPITKMLGAELGLVTLITGVILTVAVPFVLIILL